jgi:hypothetical protein
MSSILELKRYELAHAINQALKIKAGKSKAAQEIQEILRSGISLANSKDAMESLLSECTQKLEKYMVPTPLILSDASRGSKKDYMFQLLSHPEIQGEFNSWVIKRHCLQWWADHRIVLNTMFKDDPTLFECPFCGRAIGAVNIKHQVEDLNAMIAECDANEHRINVENK